MLDLALIDSQADLAHAQQKKAQVEAAIKASGGKPKAADVALQLDLERQINEHKKFQLKAASHGPAVKAAHAAEQQKTAKEKADADAKKQVETDTKDRTTGRDEAAAVLTNNDDVRKGMTPQQRKVYDLTASGTKKLDGFWGNLGNTLNPLGLGYLISGSDETVKAKLQANENIDNADAPGGRRLAPFTNKIDPITGLPGPDIPSPVTIDEIMTAIKTGKMEGVQGKLTAAGIMLPQPLAGMTHKEMGGEDARYIAGLGGPARGQLATESTPREDIGNKRLIARHVSAGAQMLAGIIGGSKYLMGGAPEKLEDRIDTAWDPVAGPALFGSTIEKIRTQLANAPGGKLDLLKKGEEKFQKDMDRHMMGIFGGSDLSSKTKDEMRNRLHSGGKNNSAAGMIAGISDSPEIGKLTRAALDAHSSEDSAEFQSRLMDINQALASAKVDPKQPVYLGGLGQDVGLSGYGVTYAVPDSTGGWKLINAPFKGDRGGKLAKLRLKSEDEQDIATLGSTWTDKEYEALPFGKAAINQYVKEQEASDAASTSGAKPKSYRPAKR